MLAWTDKLCQTLAAHPFHWPPFLRGQYAAQGEVIHNDDTKARILSLMKENEELSENDRKGIFTTGIVSKVGERYVYLYFTGREHAGEVRLKGVINEHFMEKTWNMDSF